MHFEPKSARAQGHGGPPHGPGDGALRQRGPLPACRRRVGGGAPGGGGGQRPAGAHDAARPPAQVRLEDQHAQASTRERAHTYTRTGAATRSRASRAPVTICTRTCLGTGGGVGVGRAGPPDSPDAGHQHGHPERRAAAGHQPRTDSAAAAGALVSRPGRRRLRARAACPHNLAAPLSSLQR